MNKENNGAELEWVTLQNQQDSYEKYSLLIKLANFALISTLLFSDYNSQLLPLLSAALWLQDAIWKTFQNRISDRLFDIEKSIQTHETEQSMQFNTRWLETRPSTTGLVVEYAKQAIKPTMIFPHGFLLILAVLAVM